LWLALSSYTGVAWHAAAIVAAIVLPISFIATLGVRESYGADLDFNEE
jgi:hypothetical protein